MKAKLSKSQNQSALRPAEVPVWCNRLLLLAAAICCSANPAWSQSLGDALDAPELTWTTGGNASWTAQTAVSHDGVDAAQNETIFGNEETWLQTSVVGPGPLSFWWKVSSESGYDYLEFYTNGVLVTRMAGEVDWQQLNYALGAGTHTLRWRYMKDGSVSSGQDRGWLDEVRFTPPSGPPVINSQPTNRTVYAGDTATFCVGASGGSPLAYQWQSGCGALAGETNACLSLPGLTTNLSGCSYWVVVTNAYGSATSAVATLTVLPVLTLGEALEAPELTWTTGGNASWTAQTAVTHDGVDAARSGTILDGQETWVQTSVVGPGPLSFWWKVSSEYGYDYLEFYTNSVLVTRMSGELDWQQLNYTLGAGTHTLRWRYTKDADCCRGGQDCGWLDEVRFTPPSGPPVITSQPINRTVYAGDTATFCVGASGGSPLAYQWQSGCGALAGETNACLSLPGLTTNLSGCTYWVVVTNALGAVTSTVVTLTVIPVPPSEEFQIVALSTNNSRVVDHDALTGDDRGGIAVSASQVFVTGDNATARYNAADLTGGVSLGRIVDGLCTDLRTETVYTLGEGTNALTSSGGTVTTLIELNGATGQPTGVVLPLAQSFAMPSSGNGIFSGYGRVVVYNGTRVYDIFVPSGMVVDRGAMTRPNWYNSESWAAWGVAEYFEGTLCVTYRESGTQRIVRSRVPDGTVTAVATFSGLSDMASFTVSPSRSRWYFHYEGSGQFGGTAETLGCADGVFAFANTNPPAFSLQPTSRTVYAGDTATFCVGASGGSPLAYQWQSGCGALAGETNACLSLPGLTTNLSGCSYWVVVTNAYGSATSAVATLTVLPVLTLGEALEAPELTWTTGGNASWTAQTAVTHDGVDAARSGTILDGQETWLQTSVVGPGPLSFWWKVSSESGYDYLEFYTNGVLVTRISGEVSWQQKSYMLGAGTHILRWRYVKDGSASSGQDRGWVDQVQFVPPGPTLPQILQQPNNYAARAGGTATFNVTATGTAPLAHHWRKNGISLTDGGNITGAATHTLMLSNVQTNDAGEYQVVITNAYGSVTSAVAVLTVWCGPPPPPTPNWLIAWGDNAGGQTNVPNGLTDLLAVAAGVNYNLALRADGAVTAWGAYGWVATNIPASATNVMGIAAGANTCAALRSDGTVVSWHPISGSLHDVPASATNVVAIAAGNQHYLALRADGRVVAWGYNGSGQASVPTGLSNVVAVAAGCAHSLALRSDGTVVGWGGLGCSPPPGLSQVIAIAAGGSFDLSGYSLALRADGTVVAWGSEYSGMTNVPVGLGNVVAITAGSRHAMALRADRTIVAWGSNEYGQTNVPVWLTNAVAVAAGGSHSLALFGAASPSLLTQPENMAVPAGMSVTFSVAAAGSTPLAYDWRFNGASLLGATGSELTLDDVQPGNAGSYSVVVSNAYGGVTSAVASLTVVSRPAPASGRVVAWGGNYLGQTDVPEDLTNVVAIAAGGVHNLALRADETVVAWGATNSSLGETSVPSGLTNVVAIAAAYGNSLALRRDGTVAAWGSAGFAQGRIPAGLRNVVAIAAGDNHGLGLLASGKVIAWGSNEYGQTNVPAGLSNAIAIAAGTYHSLALRADGIVVVWGRNDLGQLNVPANLSNVVAIAAGSYHSTALRSDGTVVAWGHNLFGQTNVPAGLNGVVAIANGDCHSLALRTNDTIVAWGENGCGQATVPAGLTRVLAIAGGQSHSLALVGENKPVLVAQPESMTAPVGMTLTFSVGATGAQPFAYQWRVNGQEIPGATNQEFSVVDVQTTDSGKYYSVVVSNAFGLATSEPARLTVTPEPAPTPGLVVAWGNNGAGQTDVPTGLSNVVAVSAGLYHNLALRADRTVVAWGAGGSSYNWGQTNVPAGLGNVRAVAAGNVQSVALRRDGTVVAWGDNSRGQTNVPAGLRNVVAIAAGGSSSGASFNLALMANGKVVAWGDNGLAQASVPADLSNVVAIAAGSAGLALRQDGTVVVWNGNEAPAGLSNVVAIAAGDGHNLALRQDGTIVAWGYNNLHGQTDVPSGLGRAVAVACGWQHSLAMLEDGTAVAWGWNQYGQSGVPEGMTNFLAIAGGSFHSVAIVSQITGLAPVITSQPASQSVPVGSVAMFSVTATGTRPLSYQWLKDGVPLTDGPFVQGTSTELLELLMVQPAAGGDYRVVVTNAYGSVTSAVAKLTVVAAGLTLGEALDAPELTWTTGGHAPWFAQTSVSHDGVDAAQSGPLSEGQQTWVQTSVVGPGTLSFWWKLSTAFDGYLGFATNGVGVAGLVAESDWRQFSCTLGSGTHLLRWFCDQDFDPVTAWVDQVSFVPSGLTAPTITSQPQSQTNIAGTTASFTVTATGTTPLSYQWRKDGANLADGGNTSGATNQTLTLADVQGVDAGDYQVVVANAGGAVTSAVARLTVLLPPTIIAQPQSRTNVAGMTVGFSVEAVGTEPLSYQWHFNGIPLSGATGSTLALTNVQPGQAGEYCAVVTNAFGAVTSQVATLTVTTCAPPEITSPPFPVVRQVGESVTMSCTATGTEPLSYQWRLNGTNNLAGATNTSLTLMNIQPADAGDYEVVVTNACGSTTGLVAKLMVPQPGVPPAIVVQPQSWTNVAGTAATFSVVATGTSPLRYQWHFNGVSLAGATSTNLTFASVQLTNAGSYTVVVTNAYGAVTSQVATLTVTQPAIAPFITRQPRSRTNALGTTASFSVGVTGSAPLAYQWRFNDVSLAGATSSKLTLTNVHIGNAGNYTVVVTNACGSVTSAVAVLTVSPTLPSQGWVIAWGNNTYGQTNIPAGLSNAVAVAAGSQHSLALRSDGTIVVWGGTGSATGIPAGLNDAVAIAAGDFYSLALLADSTVVAWGSDWSGETHVPADLGDVVAIAAGGSHGLALRADGTVVVWGNNDWGQTNVPAGLSDVVGVAAGVWHSLALRRDGTVVGWGGFLPDGAEARVPAGLSNVVAIAAGGKSMFAAWRCYSLALRADGTVVAWGSETVPAGLEGVSALAAGGWHSLALRTNDTLFAWGSNESGQTDVPCGLTNITAIAAGGLHSLAVVGGVGPCGSAPSITSQPQSRTNIAGTAATFSVAATGTAPLSYQWRFNGANLAGATSTDLTLTSVQPTNAGNYTVVVTNAYGSVTSQVATLTVWVPPTITAEPQSRTNVAGTTSVFCVTATGTPPLSYQWRKNGVNLTDGGNVSGATTTCLTLANVQPADAGGYTVVVTNPAGAVTSTVAALTITEPGIAPAILVQPQSRTNLPGTTANLTVVATGTTPLSYQWLKNGLRLSEGGNVSGTTSTNLTLANVQASDAGAYQVVVTNTFGSVTSQVAVLTVTSQPDIEAGLLAYYPFDADARDHSGHPEADLSNFGATPALADLRACFSFAPGAYTYHSNFNLTRVPLSISLWFKLRSVQPVGSKLIGNWGFTQSDAYRGFRVAQGSPNFLDLAVGGTPSENRYEYVQSCEVGTWYHLVACFDASGVSAYVDGVLKRRVDLALAYRAQAPKMWLGGRGTPSDDWWGDLDGWLDEVRIYDRILQPEEILLLSQQTNFAPVIVTQPRSRTNVLGTVATFTVNALGTPPLTYQWRKDGSNLSDGGNVSGATTATLTLTGVQFGDAGRYSVVVANAAGGVTSQEAMLTVIPPVPLEEGVVVAWGQNNWGQTDVPVGLSNVVAVAAGSMHNLALKNDGTVVGWGGDNYGKTTPPAGLSNAVAVAAGDNHSLALKSDGTVVGWGYNGNGQTNPPPGLSDVVAIAAGYDHNLALTGNGLVVAWGGSPLFGQTNVPASASNVVAISAGQYVSLALRGDGTLVAWGYGSSGETNIPAGATNIVAISAGRFHCLALKRDGTVLAWGNNSYGQTNVPVNLTNVVAIAGGAYHSLALQADGTLVGWGWNQSGQTTIPSELGNGNVLAIAARGNHSLALKRQAVLGVAPSIAVQPQSRTNAPGTTATFTVGALGTAPLCYQWRKDGTSLLDGGTISGAASPVLTLASVQTSNVGNYRVVITNAFGSVTSQVATLALTPAVPGNVRWQFFAGDIVAGSPAIGADGTIYVGAWNGKVFALNGATGARSWEFQAADRVHSSPAIGADGTVYVGSYDRKVYALDGATGAKRWEFATQAAVASCSPAIGVDGTVYVGSQDGRLYALDGATGQQRWAFATGGEVNSSPAIGADGTVYFGSLDGRLYALDGATGAKRWEFLTGNQIHSSPAIGADGTVYVGSYDNKVYAVDGATGRLRWTYTTGRYIWCGPTVGPDGTVYVGSHDGNVYALDGATGQRRWVTWTGGYVGSSPAIGADGTLYVGSGPGAKLFALDCATGRKLWEFRAGADVSSSVAIGADGTLYFGSHDGQVYALHSGSVGGLAESAWPMFHQNARHTGSTEAQLPIAPGIVAQPASLTVTVGASGTFGVIATGAAPLTYQWWFNNTALPAATNANFTLSNAGLANAGNYHVVVANAFGSVTSQVATLAVVPSGGSNLLAGVGHDGYVAGGTVFFDANRNGQLDANEPATTTDDQGHFELTVPLDEFDANHNGQLDPAEGCLVLQGGLDIATGQPLRTSLSAPPGSTVVTPLTALLQEMLDQTPGLSVSNAQAQLQAALGVSNRVDLTRYDPFAAAQTNDPLAGPVLRAASQVQDTIVQITALMEGTSPVQGADELAGLVTATVAAQLQTNLAFSLSAPTQIENLLTQTVSRAGVTLPTVVTEGAAQIIAEVNQLKAQAAASAGNALDAAGEISRIQGVAQGSIAEELALVGANAKVIDDAVAANTGNALQATVEAAPVGDLTGQETRPGTFAFSQTEFRVAEDGTPLTVVTVIRTDGNKGTVGLRITLSDGTARRVDGDYTATNLDLQFGDGEISRTVNLGAALTDDAEAEANETIQLSLSLLPGAPPQAQLGAPTQAALTLVDNDAPGTFAFTEAEYRVREDGTAVNAVTIRRDQGSAGVVSLIVTPAELPGGATAGSDFDPTPVVVTFLPGNMNRIVTIPVVADALAEGDESLLLSLALAPGAPSGASVGAQSSAVLTLLDVASAPPWVRLGVLPRGAGGEFKFSLTGTPGRTCVVQASSNLLAWVNTSTNLLTETPLVFTGPPAQSEVRRFYRAVLLP